MEEAAEMERRAADEYNRASQKENDAATMVSETKDAKRVSPPLCATRRACGQHLSLAWATNAVIVNTPSLVWLFQPSDHPSGEL